MTRSKNLIDDVPNIFENIEIISDTQKQLFKTLLIERLENALIPNYKSILKKQNEIER